MHFYVASLVIRCIFMLLLFPEIYPSNTNMDWNKWKHQECVKSEIGYKPSRKLKGLQMNSKTPGTSHTNITTTKHIKIFKAMAALDSL